MRRITTGVQGGPVLGTFTAKENNLQTIEDNVDIGSSTTIDRATLGSTIIRKGVKLDNHNWFAIKASGGSINIKANGVNLGSFKLTKPVKLPKNSDGVVNIGIESKFKNLLGSSIDKVILKPVLEELIDIINNQALFSMMNVYGDCSNGLEK